MHFSSFCDDHLLILLYILKNFKINGILFISITRRFTIFPADSQLLSRSFIMRKSIATIVVAAVKNVIVSNYLIYLVFVLSMYPCFNTGKWLPGYYEI